MGVDMGGVYVVDRVGRSFLGTIVDMQYEYPTKKTSSNMLGIP